ncbi:MAG: hypothetical protein Q8922_08695 [Bacteroidota bacterium]|nr:hypothetical protein [Bacteroidota bacterium]MDP4234383.1 hypothetical protein [Bacteroidota bacterium]MDP4243316.1 hypothetical protein [Bacteroidota bacterium]MDP4288001.1 hypothetical protein [Bacteroidota bacterium]
MKVYQIEDTIIAYFDGRLNDSQSAELMHRVSISPEIREIFTQHETMRRMATRAARNVSVSPNVEAAVFAEIAALQREERRKTPAGFWSIRRGAMAAAILGIISIGLAESFDRESIVVPAAVQTSAYQNPSSVATATGSPVQNANATSVTPEAATLAVKNISKNLVRSSQHSSVGIPVVAPSYDVMPASGSDIKDREIAYTAMPRETQAEHIQPPGIIAHSIADLAIAPLDAMSRYEIGIETSTQSITPANAFAAGPLQDWVLHAAYALDEHDLAGVRIERGMFGSLTVDQTASTGFNEFAASMEPTWLTTYEVYYTRRLSVDRGLFLIDGSVGAGLFSGGNFMDVSAGVRIPIAEHFLAGATWSLTRRHENGQTKQELLSSQSGPAIYDGPDIHNTLLSRIEYGLSYRF